MLRFQCGLKIENGGLRFGCGDHRAERRGDGGGDRTEEGFYLRKIFWMDVVYFMM